MDSNLKDMKREVMAGTHKSIHEYIRNRKGQRIGVMVAFLDVENSCRRLGVSQCNVKKDKFDKTRGFEMAVGRACVADQVLVCGNKSSLINTYGIPHSAWPQFEKFARRCGRYFK